MLVTPVSTWGHWFKAPSVTDRTKFRKLLLQTVDAWRQTAQPLVVTFAGHSVAMDFMAGVGAYSTLRNCVLQGIQDWEQARKANTWQQRVEDWLEGIGFVRDQGNPWQWREVNGGAKLSWQGQAARAEGALAFEKHLLREAWRKRNFYEWIASGRRDAVEVINRDRDKYDSRRSKATAKFWSQSDIPCTRRPLRRSRQ